MINPRICASNRLSKPSFLAKPYMIVPKLIIAMVLTGALAGTPSPLFAKKKPKAEKPPEISQVVALVSNSLATACVADKCKGLSEVDLTLHTEVDKDGRIGV